ncbi:MAG: energy-coupling factor transporter ATPase [Oscillospiraceae bacterium]|jgi:energy-coupling factor transport system ATP-binding protein|nr:energy-coupling factor transporter ATPase [Oscillospiraceae bacterium]
MQESAILKTEDLKFRYNRGEEPADAPWKFVLDGISIEIERGSFVAVLGHNGSGKSTLAKHFNAILLPESGKVYVEDIDTADESRLFDIRRAVGMVFQNPDNQLVATVIEEDVAFAPENMGIESKEIRQRVDDALKSVGMYEYREQSPAQLSGGQKQRVAIAGIIAMRPDCIVMDEPTSMLDPRGRREVLGTIETLRGRYGITVVLITHYMNEAAMADRLLVMNEGKIILDGKPLEVFQNIDLIKSIGLDVPQSVELIHKLNREGLNLRTDILSADDCADAIAEYFLKNRPASGCKGAAYMRVLK